MSGRTWRSRAVDKTNQGNPLHISLDSKMLLKSLHDLRVHAADSEKKVVSYMKRSVPGYVSSAVSKIYAMPKAYVAAIKRTNPNSWSRGRNASKSSVVTSSYGDTVDGMFFVFTGKKHAQWPMKPKRPYKTRRIIKVNGRRYSVPKAYQVKVETFRGKYVAIKPSKGHRVFIKPGLAAPLVVGKSNRPMVHASTSVPQAIENPRVQRIWRRRIFVTMTKRLRHHLKQALKGAS